MSDVAGVDENPQQRAHFVVGHALPSVNRRWRRHAGVYVKTILVPFIIAGSGVKGVSAHTYDERAAAAGETLAQGSNLMGALFGDAEA